MWDAKVADRPAKGIGHLVVTNICHGDHDLAFQQHGYTNVLYCLWTATSAKSNMDIQMCCIACGLQQVLKDLSQTLSTGPSYCDLFKKIEPCD